MCPHHIHTSHRDPSRKQKPSQNLTEKKSPNKQRKTRRRCVSPSELQLVDPIEATTELNNTTSQQTPAQQQLNELKHKIRLSKKRHINPTEFKFPPITPPTTRRATWRLGSGFQRRRFLRPLTGQRNSPNPEETRKQVDPDTTAPQIQTANHTSSTPGIIEAKETPLLDAKARQSKKPQTMISKHTSSGELLITKHLTILLIHTKNFLSNRRGAIISSLYSAPRRSSTYPLLNKRPFHSPPNSLRYKQAHGCTAKTRPVIHTHPSGCDCDQGEFGDGSLAAACEADDDDSVCSAF